MSGLFKVTVVMKTVTVWTDGVYVSAQNRFSACKDFLNRMPRNLSRNHIRYFEVQIKDRDSRWMISPEDVQ